MKICDRLSKAFDMSSATEKVSLKRLREDDQESVGRERRSWIREGHITDYLSWTPAGQIAGMIKELKGAGQVVDDMVTGAIDIVRRVFRG